METTKLRLLRVLSILRETDETHPCTANQIVAKLALYGIAAERKAVIRDVAALQEFGYDILQHPDNKLGYYLASREFEDWELKVMLDAVAGAGFLTEQNSKTLLGKISALSSAEGRRTLRAATPILSGIKNGDPTTKNAIDLLLQAIRGRKKVGFQYISTGSDGKKHLRFDGAEYRLSPYSLFCRQDRSYLIGSMEESRKLLYFRLDRIRELRLLEEPMIPAEQLLGPNADLQLREFVNQNLNNYSGKRTRIRLCVDADMTDLLLDTFGADFRIERIDGVKIIVSTFVGEGWGLNSWLLQHGDCVQILEPESIREEVIALLETIREKYQAP